MNKTALRTQLPVIVLSLATAAMAPGIASAAPEPAAAGDAGSSTQTVVVTARLRQEDAQQVPISLSVVNGAALEKTRTDNVSQLTQLVPSLNYTSPNPRNTAYTIRGLGSSVLAIAQSNDGLEPGVGFYVDQVYHGRPATAAFDFTDLERVEVLRGPQGTLFGKNTTAGAINITSKAPTFDGEAKTELSYGNFDYYQGKAALNGALIDNLLAGRLSAAVTGRGGVLDNVGTDHTSNDIHNVAARGQLLYTPTDALRVRFIGDYSSFKNNCCTQVYFGVGTTLKPAARQYPALAAGLNYAPPSLDPYDRLTDIDAALKVDTNEGGLSATADWNLGAVTFTSVSAWRWWNWDAANDRDYTSLVIQTQQHIPSRQDQYSQEFRIASNGTNKVDYVAGLYWFSQTITGEPITQYGSQATYWLLGPAPQFPSNLLDGYITDGDTRFHSDSYAAFGEATWHATERLALTAGLRFTNEGKDGRYASTVSGGLATTTPALVNAKLSILRPQAYTAVVSDNALSGRVNVAYTLSDQVMTYASYAHGNKSGGINMSGLPLNAANLPALATAVVKPEKNKTAELGVKTRLFGQRLLLNVDIYHTTVDDFQTNVVDTGPGALRGYLANIEKVRVQGAELDSSFSVTDHFNAHAAVAWTEGKYVSYQNGPCPLELIGNATTVCDLSGRPFSGTPKFVGSLGGEYLQAMHFGSVSGNSYLQAEITNRGDTYGDPSDSKYTLISGYTLVNASLGFRTDSGWELSLWARNLLDRDYMQNLTVQAGNSGLIVGTPSDPRTYGATVRVTF
ncbi:MAG: TonB-dependent receptor [Gammaproteobacteria bacterium]